MVSFVSEYPTVFEADHEIVELRKDYLAIYIKPSSIESLKELTKNNETIYGALLTLLRWAHHPIIPLPDIVDVSVEVIPTPPGGRELARLIIKSKFHGGYRLLEVHLSLGDAQKLAAEIKELISPKF
ncbi:MAG: hypothetical protein QXJ75_04630 [Candidatus Bathyarchaeia archaeon]